MEVELFVICDAATDTAGKINILGVFDTIITKEIPTTLPSLSYAIKIRFYKDDEKEHNFLLRVHSPEGKIIEPSFNGKFGFTMVEGEETGSLNLILNIFGLKFDTLGRYTAELLIDDIKVKTIPIIVKKQPPSTNGKS
ncbi:MAG: hypothetical protein ABSC61_10650 [Anaerolineales bacterium]